MHASRWAPHNNEDAFAQTREPDNLFDDDIVPVSEPVVQQLPIAEHSVHQSTPHQPRSRGSSRGRGRGRGARNIESPRRQDSATPQSNDSKQSDPVKSSSHDNAATETKSSTPSEHTSQGAAQEATSSDVVATEPATAAEAPKVQAVRGPRHQTGGIQRPKLTEDELSARMAAAALNNAKREAAHKEAEADAAKFEAREAAARQRRHQETAARRVMDNERERNRQRKLGAQGVREWDLGKDESQLSGGQQQREYRSGPRGGGAGDEAAREHLDNVHDVANGEDGNRGGFRGRGRGRGRGQRGRGRGRGAYDGSSADAAQANNTVPPLGEDHFPTLITTPKDQSSTSTKQSSAAILSPIADKGTWADQVEASQQ